MKYYEALRAWLTRHAHSIEATHLYGHCAYFLAVFIEGHGFYSICAGALLIVTILIGVIGGQE